MLSELPKSSLILLFLQQAFVVSKDALLTYLGDLVLVLESRDRQVLYRIMDDKVWVRECVTTASPFEHADSDNDQDDTTSLSHCTYHIVFHMH